MKPKIDPSTVEDEKNCFKCTECPNVYETKRKLTSHRRSHTLGICPNDNCKLILRARHLKRHIEICNNQKIKKERKIYICDICSYVAPSQQRLGIHLGKHSKQNQTKPLPKCTFCDFQSKRSFNVKKHIQTCKSKYESVVVI